ncbi:MAG: TlpA family protein disulfide reductase [Bacteroidetes bacterium]|nr:TlpA family protein disulfide reductase [Bacteroidota bacterium]
MNARWKIISLITVLAIICAYFVLSTIEVEKGEERGYKIENIIGVNPEGKEIALFNIKDKFILIDFWASWCMPCRKMNPDLVEFYKKNNSNIEIFSISLDNDIDKWKQAIEKDGLIWANHICELKGWESPSAIKYHIEEIPNNILVNKEGVIIGRNIDLDEIEELCK